MVPQQDLQVHQLQQMVHALTVLLTHTRQMVLPTVLTVLTKLVAVLQLVPQGRTYLLYARPGLPVIPVHAQLVLLGQILQVLPT